jgi:NodT family efflux transporter outer membrane factor (OMF) lipoprotein
VKRAAAILVLLASGCTTVGPNYQRPNVAVPERFQEAIPSGASDADLAGWWRGFGDPQLSALIELAVAQNLDVQMAAARIREARALERSVGAAGSPQVAAQASATRQRISENAIPVPPGSGGGAAFGLPGSEFNTFRVGFDASWELDLFGRTHRSVEAANARTGAAVWNRRDVQVSVAAEVASAYFRLRAAQAELANAQAELDRQERLERLIAAQVRGGLTDGQELSGQSSARAAAAAAIPAFEAEAKAEIHALGVLVGSTPEALTARLREAAAIPAAPTIPAGLPSDLLRRRPDIRAAERNLAASTADIGVAVADLYPRISLTAAPALVSTALASLLEWGSRSFSVGAALDWPLFDGGRRRATVEAKNARQEQAMIAYRKTVLGGLRDVEDALSRIDADRVQLAERQEAVREAARAEQLSNTRYRGGLVTYADVLTQQARRLSMEKQVVETRGALARDTASLAKALGGGWPELAEGAAQ